jgi:hypothetical protein
MKGKNTLSKHFFTPNSTDKYALFQEVYTPYLDKENTSLN